MEIDIIYNDDCLHPVKGMSRLPEKVASLILCDLPYGTTQNKWDSILPLQELWKQYERIMKDNGVIVLTASQPFASAVVMSNISMFKYDMIWDKKRPTGQLNVKKQPLRQHEHILVFYRTQPTYNPIMHSNRLKRDFIGKSEKSKKQSDNYGQQYDYMSNIEADALSWPRSIIEQTTVIGNSKEKLPHPTQKPVALFEHIIKTYTDIGDIVIDNCVGSGTTAEACINTGRRFVCWENDEKYYLMAKKRIENVKLQKDFTLGI